jgi:hypothetical protein
MMTTVIQLLTEQNKIHIPYLGKRVVQSEWVALNGDKKKPFLAVLISLPFSVITIYVYNEKTGMMMMMMRLLRDSRLTTTSTTLIDLNSSFLYIMLIHFCFATLLQTLKLLMVVGINLVVSAK